MANPSTYRDNLEMTLHHLNEGIIDRYVGGDWRIWSFQMKMRKEVPELARMVPLIGPMHTRFNTMEGIRDLAGELLLWACALAMGWTGLKYIAKTYQKMEDLIVIVTCASVRALEIMGLPFDFIFDKCEEVLSEERYDVRVRYLLWYINYLGGNHCYMRAVARTGRTIEWLDMLSTMHKFFHIANMKNYENLQSQFFFLLLKSGLTVQDLNVVFNSLFIRLNPFNKMCIPLDDISEQVRDHPQTPLPPFSVFSFLGRRPSATVVSPSAPGRRLGRERREY
jgi:hypothetical protein